MAEEQVRGFPPQHQERQPHLKEGSAIINTTSITAFQGNPKLLDYSSTKGALLSFTRALSQNLAEAGIRVNAVARAQSGRRSFRRVSPRST